MNTKTLKRLAQASLLALAAAGLAAQAYAVDVKKIAIMIPEEPNDYG